MAVVNTKSTEVTNGDAAVQTQNALGTSHGRLYMKCGTIAVAAADDDNSTLRIARVHSSWILYSLRIFCDAITAGTSYDVGLYQIAAAGGAVVDVDAYASAVDLSSAKTTAPIEVICEARDIIKIGQKVYQDAGLTADSNRWYDLVLTANTIGSAAGDISWLLEFNSGA
jgi:hypothetical protein